MTHWGRCQKLPCRVGPTIFQIMVQWDLTEEEIHVLHHDQGAEWAKLCAKRMAPNILDKKSTVTKRLGLVTKYDHLLFTAAWTLGPWGISPDALLLKKPVSPCDKRLWEVATIQNSEYHHDKPNSSVITGTSGSQKLLGLRNVFTAS